MIFVLVILSKNINFWYAKQRKRKQKQAHSKTFKNIFFAKQTSKYILTSISPKTKAGGCLVGKVVATESRDWENKTLETAKSTRGRGRRRKRRR
jgi:hypothetical protein